MSLYGVGLNVQVLKINTEFRLYISKQKGGLNIRNLQQIFRQFDLNGNGKLDMEEFAQGLNKFGFFLKKVDYQCLVKYYDADHDGHISYEEFLAGIKEPLNERRLNFVLKIFHSIDTQRTGSVSPFALTEKLEVVKNKDYQMGSKTRNQLVSEFVLNFNRNHDGNISQGEFVSFFEDFGLGITSDQHFIELLSSQWGVQEDDDLAVTREEIKGIVKIIRQRLTQMTKGTNEEFLLRKLFKEFDINKSGFLSLDELHSMLIKLEIPIQKRYLNAIFSIFDKNRSGTIEFEEFTSYIVNDPYP